MTDTLERIPFHVEISRVIEVLAKQIYQSPLALLRENTQNAFDAVLMRRHLGANFDPLIRVNVTTNQVVVDDNGIGMTREDLRSHFWRAGSSGKNNAEAQAAGVVGTFGIGAMANFGVAEELTVVTESAKTHERTQSYVRRDKLSATEDCIDLVGLPSTGSPGTVVTAKLLPQHSITASQAEQYLSEFVGYLAFKVEVNGKLISQKAVEQAIPRPTEAWSVSEHLKLNDLEADSELVVTQAGDVWIRLKEIQWRGVRLGGSIVLRQGTHQIRTHRSGFGLAAVGVSSDYQLGGFADIARLQPTAGREALTTESMQLLQSIVSAVDGYVSERLGTRPESNGNLSFMNWATRHGRIDLCGHLRVRTEPKGYELTLAEIRERTAGSPMNLYSGSNAEIIEMYASEDQPLLVAATTHPRRDCELQFLRRFAKVSEVGDQPRPLSVKKESDYTLAESALVFRLVSVLETDYFVSTQVKLGEISHGLPILVSKESKPPQILLSLKGDTIRTVLQVYESDYPAFGNLVKDYVRSAIFPKIADLVPTSTRNGAAAFLKLISTARETFEYEATDLGSLTDIWSEYLEGKLTMAEAAQRSAVVASGSIQVVDASQSKSMSEVVPDVVANQQTLEAEQTDVDPLEALPAITRLDKSSTAKLLTIGDDQPALKGYRAFLAISDRVRRDKGEFFLGPHRTSVVWGGQKALFVFQHQSGAFGLYYDLQTSQVVSAESGGGAFPTCTIVLKDNIYVPIPEPIRRNFIPDIGEKKRFEIRCDLLYTDLSDTSTTTS